MQVKKSTFFIDQNTSLCCLQQTVHCMLAVKFSSVYRHQNVTRSTRHNLITTATCKYQTAHSCWCADELFICTGDLWCVVCTGFVVFCLWQLCKFVYWWLVAHPAVCVTWHRRLHLVHVFVCVGVFVCVSVCVCVCVHVWVFFYLICVWPCIINVGKVIQKNQLDAKITIYWLQDQLNMFWAIFCPSSGT